MLKCVSDLITDDYLHTLSTECFLCRNALDMPTKINIFLSSDEGTLAKGFRCFSVHFTFCALGFHHLLNDIDASQYLPILRFCFYRSAL